MVAITHPGAIAHPMRIRRPFAPAVYRRRRVAVAGAVLLALAVVVAVLGIVGRGAEGLPSEPVATVSVVVQPGDSVWSLASSLAGDRDPRPIVDAIVDANGGATLVAGQRLTLTVP